MVKQNSNSDFHEVKKMKQGMSYSSKEKTIIMNVFKYFRSQYSDKNVTEIVRYTSKATGCSEKSIFSFRKEEVSPQGFKEPSKTKIRTKVNINNRLIKYNECTRELIKKVIYDLKRKNISPSLSIILKNLNAIDNIPKFSLMTLRRLLSDMGFYYEKSGNKSILVEKSRVKEGILETNKKNMPSFDICTSSSNLIHNDKVKTINNTDINTKSTSILSAPEKGQKLMPLLEINNVNPQPFVHHQVYKDSLYGNFGNTRENNFISIVSNNLR